MATITGSAGNDDLRPRATAAADLAIGNNGADTLAGLDGNDTIWGDDTAAAATGDGGDSINAGAGSDVVRGGGGDDAIDGGAGNDTLDGGAGRDIANYASATAAVDVSLALTGAQDTGGAGTDTLVNIEEAVGSAFNDTLTGDGGDNALLGGGGDDIVEGGAGVDVVWGEGGNDALAGGAGVDGLNGGGGDDTVEGGAGDDAIYGAGGNDTASYATATARVDVSLALVGLQNTSGAGTDGLWNVEALLGSAFNDSLTGSARADTLAGGAGDDTLTGGNGADLLDGAAGDDSVTGGAGNDTFTGGAGTDIAAVAGTRGGYTVANGQDAGGFYTLVTDNNPADGGSDGTDKVYGAETLRFADQDVVICFYPGTLVATPEGEVPVEALRAGALVLTADGRAAPVRWLGRQTVSTRFADPLRVLPVRIAAGALGEGLPARDLLLSPDHALLVDGVLVQAGALVNGTTIRREERVPEVFTYWHVELADHALVLAEGVPAETFIDNVARLAFDNWDEHEAAGTEAPIAEMALPRAKSRRQVPMATRRRLEERTAFLLGEETAAA